MNNNENKKVVFNSEDYSSDPSVTSVQLNSNDIQSKTVNTSESKIVSTSPTKNELIKNENPWFIKKNIPKFTQEEIKNLTASEKKSYQIMRGRPSKSGRFVEIKKHQNIYRVSVLDYLPLFLGQIYSLIRLMVAYGDVKRTINFDKRLMADMKNNLIVSLVYALFLWPLVVICLFIFYPFMALNSSDVTRAWMEISSQGANGITSYLNQAVWPLFNSSHLAVTIVVWILIGMANTQTLVFFALFRFNKKKLFGLQKNYIRQEVKRIRVQIEKNKKKLNV